MSSEVMAETRRAQVAPEGGSWDLWIRQALAILRLELRRNFFSTRTFLLYLLAGAPVMLMLLFNLAGGSREGGSLGDAAQIFANIYQGFILQFVTFFGCVWVFTNLIRGEVLDRSLHYYFLAPVRRQVLVAGKFLAGLTASATLFCACTALSYILLYLPYGLRQSMDHLLNGPGMGQLLAYVATTALACLGYGAVFLLIGLYFRNPIVPAGMLLGWELINFLLPAVLKKASIIHYLRGLLPVPVSDGPFALITDPPSVWVSVGGLLLLTAVILLLAGRRIRKMEIQYGDD